MSKDNSYMVFVYLALYASLLMFLIFLTDPSANPYDVALVNSLWAYLPLVVIANVFVHKHLLVITTSKISMRASKWWYFH